MTPRTPVITDFIPLSTLVPDHQAEPEDDRLAQDQAAVQAREEMFARMHSRMVEAEGFIEDAWACGMDLEVRWEPSIRIFDHHGDLIQHPVRLLPEIITLLSRREVRR